MLDGNGSASRSSAGIDAINACPRRTRHPPAGFQAHAIFHLAPRSNLYRSLIPTNRQSSLLVSKKSHICDNIGGQGNIDNA